MTNFQKLLAPGNSRMSNDSDSSHYTLKNLTETLPFFFCKKKTTLSHKLEFKPVYKPLINWNRCYY